MKFTLLVIFIISIPCMAQSKKQIIKNLVEKINYKLQFDKNYLNLNYISLHIDDNLPEILSDLPKSLGEKSFKFNHGEGKSYQLVFLNKGVYVDSIELLYISQISLKVFKDKNILQNIGSGSSQDTTIVYNYRDMYNLKNNYPQKYLALLKEVNSFINQNPNEELPSIIKIKLQNNNLSSFGFSARDNSDFLSDARINSSYYYPYPSKSSFFGRNNSSDFPLRLFLSFSDITITSSIFDFENGNMSLFLNTKPKVVNLLPWESNIINYGIRILLFSNKKGVKDINNSSYTDLSLFLRHRTDFSKLTFNLPFLIAYGNNLNLSDAYGGYIRMTRPLGLPTMNLYIALGNRNFDNPIYKIKNSNGYKSYYSINQFSYSFSFYWNTDNSLKNRFRFDIGVAYFDLFETDISLGTHSQNSKFSDSILQPWFNIYINFFSDAQSLAGINAKYFDSEINLYGWIKLLEISERNSISLGLNFISPPIARQLRTWEYNGSREMFELRYNYGL